MKFIIGVVGLCLLATMPLLAQEKEGEEEKPKIQVGGALRFNYNLSSWKDGQQKRGGDFGYDLFRINAKASYKGVKLNAEYRLYSSAFGGGMLKQGWIAYDFNTKDELQLGLTQVPFGITQYDSHNWFFGLNYYVGLEDDHDMGLKFKHRSEKWDYDIAFFKNAEELNFGSNSDVSDSRYSYDVASIDYNGDGSLQFRNKEVNQVNGKLVYKLLTGSVKHKLGASVQYGGLYNLTTEDMGNHYALAGHYELLAGRFDLKAQVSHYEYSPENPEGERDDIIAMTAYGAPYLTAASATTYTLGVGYVIPVTWGPVSQLKVYDDFGYMQKSSSAFSDTYINVSGVMVTAGQVYTYIDLAAGKNHPWIGPEWTEGLAQGNPKAEWETRFNINIGYYF
ncbi:hypothetical protein [Fulvivirga sediminis]|uniref:hypothetical protein n=1 Tax=Fulvivirga sediminis TaxID=2803949 RepID=UPI001F3389D7|nr:hypothetical protein [Fulvivirga sediminis]